LLIGVGRYENLPPAFRLAAPGNDVRRLSAALTFAGYPAHRIESMTDDGSRVPTRSVVLQALAAIASEAGPGQEILIYFSGHGAQSTARYPEREPDGLQEVYLMADARRLDGSSVELAGAIADYELEAAIARIRSTGADVVLVADACHAAGITRSLLPGGRVKGLTSEELGLSISPAALRGLSSESAPVYGDFTGIFAAAPGGLAVERSLPLGQPEATPASVFTYALAQAIRDGRHRTWRDLQEGTREAAFETGPGPVPVFEGGLEKAPAGLAADRPRWFRTYASSAQTIVAAGSLEGIVPGDVVELADLSGGHLGQVVVTDGDALTARLATSVEGSRRARRMQEGNRQAFLLSIAPHISNGRPNVPLDITGLVEKGDCESSIQASGLANPGAEYVNLGQRPLLSHCDVLFIRLRNQDANSLDIAVFFVNARGQVTPMTLAPDNSPRLAPGQSRNAALRVLTKDATGNPLVTGEETIVVAWTPARGRTPRDLRALSDTYLKRSKSETEFQAQAFTIVTVPHSNTGLGPR
jgi:hypothetical protein